MNGYESDNENLQLQHNLQPQQNENIHKNNRKTKKYRKRKNLKTIKDKELMKKSLHENMLDEEDYDLQARQQQSFTKLKKIMTQLKKDKLNSKSQKLHRSILDKYGNKKYKRTKKNLVGLSMQPENYGEYGFPQHIKHTGFNYKGNKPNLFTKHSMKNMKNLKTQQLINNYKKNMLAQPKTLTDILYNLNPVHESDLQVLENTGYESDNESNEHNEYHNLFSQYENSQQKHSQQKQSFSSSQSYSNIYSKSYSQHGDEKPEIKENKTSLTTYTNSTLPDIYYKLTKGDITQINKIPKST